MSANFDQSPTSLLVATRQLLGPQAFELALSFRERLDRPGWVGLNSVSPELALPGFTQKLAIHEEFEVNPEQCLKQIKPLLEVEDLSTEARAWITYELAAISARFSPADDPTCAQGAALAYHMVRLSQPKEAAELIYLLTERLAECTDGVARRRINARIHNMRGGLLQALGDFEGADSEYAQALGYAVDTRERKGVYLNRMECALALRRAAQASESLALALDEDPALEGIHVVSVCQFLQSSVEGGVLESIPLDLREQLAAALSRGRSSALNNEEDALVLKAIECLG